MAGQKNRYRYVGGLGLSTLLVLVSCAMNPPPQPEVQKPALAPVPFECSDGSQFSISFSKKNDDATLIFNGHSTPEILEDKRLASGIEYGNENYTFREHQGIVKLIDETQDDAVETLCHKAHVK